MPVCVGGSWLGVLMVVDAENPGRKEFYKCASQRGSSF